MQFSSPDEPPANTPHLPCSHGNWVIFQTAALPCWASPSCSPHCSFFLPCVFFSNCVSSRASSLSGRCGEVSHYFTASVILEKREQHKADTALVGVEQTGWRVPLSFFSFFLYFYEQLFDTWAHRDGVLQKYEGCITAEGSHYFWRFGWTRFKLATLVNVHYCFRRGSHRFRLSIIRTAQFSILIRDRYYRPEYQPIPISSWYRHAMHYTYFFITYFVLQSVRKTALNITPTENNLLFVFFFWLMSDQYPISISD